MPTAIDLGQPVNRSSPLNKGLVSWWMALPYSPYWGGPRFLDLCGRNHGTLTNGPVWGGSKGTPGAFGTVTGNNTNAQINATVRTLSGGLTIYIRTAHTQVSTQFKHYVFWGTSDGATGFSLGSYTTSPSTRTAVYGHVSNVSSLVIEPNIPLVIDSHHFIILSDVASGSCTYNLNGAPVGTDATPGNFSACDTMMMLHGYYSSSDHRFSDAVLSQVKLYDRAFSTADCRAAIDDSRQGYPTTLNWYKPKVYFDMGGGGGVSVPMLVGGKLVNNGILLTGLAR